MTTDPSSPLQSDQTSDVAAPGRSAYEERQATTDDTPLAERSPATALFGRANWESGPRDLRSGPRLHTSPGDVSPDDVSPDSPEAEAAADIAEQMATALQQRGASQSAESPPARTNVEAAGDRDDADAVDVEDIAAPGRSAYEDRQTEASN